MVKINENIYRLTIPYKDVYTTVYAVKTQDGVLLFDCASYDEDIKDYIIPFLHELKITPEILKYVFISHKHADHAGGLNAFIKKFPNTCIVSRSTLLAQTFDRCAFLMPKENDKLLGVLRVITIPGHTEDSCAIYDERTKTMITGDCLQLYGIYGSGKWASNISFVCEHIDAIQKLRTMEIRHILTAHDYHPYGYSYEGETISKALDACIAPLMEIESMIRENPHMDDEQVCALYNASDMPTLGSHVVTAVRKALCK